MLAETSIIHAFKPGDIEFLLDILRLARLDHSDDLMRRRRLIEDLQATIETVCEPKLSRPNFQEQPQ